MQRAIWTEVLGAKKLTWFRWKSDSWCEICRWLSGFHQPLVVAGELSFAERAAEAILATSPEIALSSEHPDRREAWKLRRSKARMGCWQGLISIRMGLWWAPKMNKVIFIR